ANCHCRLIFWACPSQKPRVALSAASPHSFVPHSLAGFPLLSLTQDPVRANCFCLPVDRRYDRPTRNSCAKKKRAYGPAPSISALSVGCCKRRRNAFSDQKSALASPIS